MSLVVPNEKGDFCKAIYLDLGTFHLELFGLQDVSTGAPLAPLFTWVKIVAIFRRQDT